MKNLLMASILMISMSAAAQEKKDPAAAATATPAVQPRMTTKDAKKSCKDEGKTGADLIQCMKDKKEEK